MKRPPRSVWIPSAAVIVLAGFFLALRSRADSPQFTTAAVDRGDIADVVGATGILQAVVTVQVGSQVSGNIEELHADFNSTVKKDQVIARLDPSSFQARLAQAKANLTVARANVARSQAAIDDTQQKYRRAQELAGENLLPATDLETARANHESAVAQLRASTASAEQAEASLHQAEVDLQHTVIRTPIDGVVLARNVDVGQTVAASLQAPTLFVIANDLSRMQVNASVDEADIGRIHTGQDVTFRVDAYPDRTFRGRVEQVRLQPVTVNNVVTYNTIITVDNEDLKLMPGMTATVSVEIAKRDDVLRIPAAALRYRPEGFEDERPRDQARGERRGQRGEKKEGGPGQAEDGGSRPGRVFLPGPDGKPEPRPIRLGLSDGRFVEVVEGLEEGASVITADGGGARTAGSGSTTNPFDRPRFQPRSR